METGISDTVKPYGYFTIRRMLPASDLCWLSYEPGNEIAKKLYASFGFVEKPEYYKEGDEMPAVLKL